MQLNNQIKKTEKKKNRETLSDQPAEKLTKPSNYHTGIGNKMKIIILKNNNN